MPKLTDAAAHKKKADPNKRIELHDGNGLYLVVQPSGSKSWAYRYRIEGQSRKLTLGILLDPDAKPDTDAAGELPALSVTEARQRASAAGRLDCHDFDSHGVRLDREFAPHQMTDVLTTVQRALHHR